MGGKSNLSFLFDLGDPYALLVIGMEIMRMDVISCSKNRFLNTSFEEPPQKCKGLNLMTMC